MNTKQILGMNKKELISTIKGLPFHYQPQWLNRGTKDELAGFLMTGLKIEEVAKAITLSFNKEAN